MSFAEDVAIAAAESDERFHEVLRRALRELGVNISEFSKLSGMPQSTLYKAFSSGRAPNLRTVREIVSNIKKIEKKDEEPFIAVIVSRSFLNELVTPRMKVGAKDILVREYPANTMEDVIVEALQAEREGASAIVCAPIVSPTIERVVKIPIVTIVPKDSLGMAIKTAAKKIS